jgi:hypothetical protein
MTRRKQEVPEEDEETEVPAVTGDASDVVEKDDEEADVEKDDDVTGDAPDVVEEDDEEAVIEEDDEEAVVEEDDEEAVVEDVSTDEAGKTEDIPKKMKTVAVEEWSRLNSQPPLWTRYAQTILTWVATVAQCNDS